MHQGAEEPLLRIASVNRAVKLSTQAGKILLGGGGRGAAENQVITFALIIRGQEVVEGEGLVPGDS